MELLCWIAIAILGYYYAKDTKEKYPGLDIDPINYAVGGFVFGIFSLLWCWNKKRNYIKYNR